MEPRRRVTYRLLETEEAAEIMQELAPAGRIISVPTSEWRNWQTR